MYPSFNFQLSRYTVGGIVIGLALAAIIKAWLQL